MLTVAVSRPLPRAAAPWRGLALAAVHTASLIRGHRLVVLCVTSVTPARARPRNPASGARLPRNPSARRGSCPTPACESRSGQLLLSVAGLDPRRHRRSIRLRLSSADARASYPRLGNVVRSLPVALGPRPRIVIPNSPPTPQAAAYNFQSYLERKEPTEHESRHEQTI